MNLTIGNKIKTLRKQRGITQEQLAQSLGISFQAVSKWENNIALPDITLAPALASYFGVTMDELFEYNLKQTQQKIEEICDAAYVYRGSDPQKSRAVGGDTGEHAGEEAAVPMAVCGRFHRHEGHQYPSAPRFQPAVEFYLPARLFTIRAKSVILALQTGKAPPVKKKTRRTKQ